MALLGSPHPAGTAPVSVGPLKRTPASHCPGRDLILMKSHSPTHEATTQRAKEIWQRYGSPGGRDTEIWLEAERQLTEDSNNSPRENSTQYESPRTTSESKGAVKLADRLKSETAAESIV